jgi:hypothetical protein
VAFVTEVVVEQEEGRPGGEPLVLPEAVGHLAQNERHVIEDVSEFVWRQVR